MKLKLSGTDDLNNLKVYLRRVDFALTSDLYKYRTLLSASGVPVTVAAMAAVALTLGTNLAASGGNVPTVVPATSYITHLSCVVDAAATFSANVDLQVYRNNLDVGSAGFMRIPPTTNSRFLALDSPILLNAGDYFNLRVTHAGVAVAHALWGFAWGYCIQ